jgi:hypothetical protein
MSEFPPIPKPQKKIFSDVEKRAAKTEFRKALRKAFFELHGSLPANKSQLKILIARFTGLISPSEIVRLPYFSPDGKAKRRNKNDCVAALISWIIQEGWRFQEDTIGEEQAYAAIEKLTQITKAGINKCKVVGGPKGYELEVGDENISYLGHAE